ncbi:hypothetical protein WJX74_000785 [Apatococcus lobatus]|uniref:Enhancer of polycomb-like protein n=1 Tax=Apatococcus lobatus TaxID=904363 RepID=A0AAW1QKL6_9CHLO
MSTRLSFRPRPLDLNKPLTIVRDINELDAADGLVSRDITHQHEALDKDNEEAKMIQSKKARGGQEIPVPKVRRVETYTRDYLPIFQEHNTYLRGRGGRGWRDDRFVEYGLDVEDEEWVRGMNRGQNRLPPGRLEQLLWALEVANAAATDRALTAAGAATGEKTSAAAVAAIDHMTAEEALAALESSVPGLRPPVRDAVFQYWKTKRSKQGKPLLRRLQAPTNPSDTNPFNVFRPREKIHRPQTRRRRENNDESLEKMKMLKQNVVKAHEIVRAVIWRERRKRDSTYWDINIQQLQLKLQHDPRSQHEATEAEYQAIAKSKASRPLGFEWRPAMPIMSEPPPDSHLQIDAIWRIRKRRREGNKKIPPLTMGHMPPPPLQQPPLDLLFCHPPPLQSLPQPTSNSQTFPPVSAGGHTCRPRFGRGGRLILDRCRPFTSDSLSSVGDDNNLVLPLHLLPNPFSQPRPLQTGAPSAPALDAPVLANGTAPPALPSPLPSTPAAQHLQNGLVDGLQAVPSLPGPQAGSAAAAADPGQAAPEAGAASSPPMPLPNVAPADPPRSPEALPCVVRTCRRLGGLAARGAAGFIHGIVFLPLVTAAMLPTRLPLPEAPICKIWLGL